jgi:hypothetical protein
MLRLCVVLPLRRCGLAVSLLLAALACATGAAVAVIGGVQQVEAVEVHVGVDEVVEGGGVGVRYEPLRQREGLPLDWHRWQQRRAELRETKGRRDGVRRGGQIGVGRRRRERVEREEKGLREGACVLASAPGAGSGDLSVWDGRRSCGCTGRQAERVQEVAVLRRA